jgi:hypothetical protein
MVAVSAVAITVLVDDMGPLDLKANGECRDGVPAL